MLKYLERIVSLCFASLLWMTAFSVMTAWATETWATEGKNGNRQTSVLQERNETDSNFYSDVLPLDSSEDFSSVQGSSKELTSPPATSSTGKLAPETSQGSTGGALIKSTPPRSMPHGRGSSWMGGGDMLQVLAALVGVLILIAGASWMIRRLSGGVTPANSLIKVLANYPLGVKQRIVLVDINGVCLLLGVSAEQVNCLHEFKQGEIESDQLAANHFSQKLQEVLAKGVFK